MHIDRFLQSHNPPIAQSSISNHLHQHALRTAPVELPVKDLLPGPEIQLPLGDRDDDLAPHHLPLHVGVGVVFAGAVVAVAIWGGVEGGELLEPLLVVLVQAGLVGR